MSFSIPIYSRFMPTKYDRGNMTFRVHWPGHYPVELAFYELFAKGSYDGYWGSQFQFSLDVAEADLGTVPLTLDVKVDAEIMDDPNMGGNQLVGSGNDWTWTHMKAMRLPVVRRDGGHTPSTTPGLPPAWDPCAREPEYGVEMIKHPGFEHTYWSYHYVPVDTRSDTYSPSETGLVLPSSEQKTWWEPVDPGVSWMQHYSEAWEVDVNHSWVFEDWVFADGVAPRNGTFRARWTRSVGYPQMLEGLCPYLEADCVSSPPIPVCAYVAPGDTVTGSWYVSATDTSLDPRPYIQFWFEDENGVGTGLDNGPTVILNSLGAGYHQVTHTAVAPANSATVAMIFKAQGGIPEGASIDVDDASLVVTQ